jgi:hypothetical protein
MLEDKQLAMKRKKIRHYKTGLHIELSYGQLDGRTSVAKNIKVIRESLREYVGKVSAAADILITRISYKAVKLALYELNALQDLKNYEAGYYIPLSNSLRLDLQALANLADKPKPPDLDGYLKEFYGSNDEHNKNP